MNMMIMRRGIYIIIFLYLHQLKQSQSLFFEKQTTISSAQKAAQEKIRSIVTECMEKEKSNPLHVYALFAVHTHDLQAQCVLLCVMHECKLMDEDGHYNKEKVEEIMRRTKPKPQSKFLFFGRNKAGDNETLKECIDKDYRNDSCERAFVFTQCLQKQTKKSFNTLTGDLYNQASENNNTLELQASTESSIIISTLETITSEPTVIGITNNNITMTNYENDTAVQTNWTTTIEVENNLNMNNTVDTTNQNITTWAIKNSSMRGLTDANNTGAAGNITTAWTEVDCNTTIASTFVTDGEPTPN